MSEKIINDLNKINDIKNSIKDTINSNGGNIGDNMPFADYNNVLKDMLSEEWQPQPDWWDIDAILEEDTEDYAGKMIVLLNDSRDTITLPISYWTIMGADKIRFSDGIEYISPKTEINHTWDKTQDKECSLGYKTRYIIFYWKDDTNFGVWDFNNIFESLYIIHKGMNISTSRYDFQYNRLKICECIKFTNCILDCNNGQLIFNSRAEKIEFNNSNIINVSNFKQLLNNNIFISNDNINMIYELTKNANIDSFDSSFFNCINLENINMDLNYTRNATTVQLMFSGCYNLKYINDNNELDLSNCISAVSLFSNCRKIKNVNLKNTRQITNFSNAFADCYNLKSVGEINTESCTNMSTMFSTCFNLKYVNLTDTSKVTNMFNLFLDCQNLQGIENINFESVSNIKNMFVRCYSLSNINNISNIKISGINFSECKILSYDTLLRIINALYDYVSEGNEETHTITLGSTNLAKLTEEEIAVGTEKGWTIS